MLSPFSDSASEMSVNGCTMCASVLCGNVPPVRMRSMVSRTFDNPSDGSASSAAATGTYGRTLLANDSNLLLQAGPHHWREGVQGILSAEILDERHGDQFFHFVASINQTGLHVLKQSRQDLLRCPLIGVADRESGHVTHEDVRQQSIIVNNVRVITTLQLRAASQELLDE